MFFDLTSLFVTFLCFIIILMILKSYRYNHRFDFPFFIIMILVGVQRFQNSTSNLNLINITSPFEKSPYLALICIPFFLLFFKNSSKEIKISFRDLIHFIIPFVFLFLNKLQFLSESFNKIFFLLFTITYWVMMFLIILKDYKKQLFKFSYNKILFRWKFLMFSNLTLITFFLNYHVLYWKIDDSGNLLTEFYRGSSLVWVFCLVYVILNPVIIFGKDYLLNQLDTRSKFFDPWSYRPLIKIQKRDLFIHRKLFKSIPDIIFKLKSNQKDLDFLKNQKTSVEEISKELKIPNSHLKYLFKYYNRLSTHEYFNLLKIILSLRFIQNGFLHDHTIESLSKASNFKSRITFFNNFKKYTGKSPSEFIKV